ncbi:MAG: hypothetical protein RBU37_22850, partial [Myxococcota bacterium]|nr:hypothetical protein [Myxococcota bacterium]
YEPADRIWLGVSGAGQSVAGEQRWVGSAHLGVDLLWVWALGEGRDAVRWQFEHGFVEGRVDLGQEAAAQLWSADLTLYSGWFHRHSQSGSLTIPSSPPRRIDFPLDLAIWTNVGRVRLEPLHEGEEEGIDLVPAEAFLCFDFLRSEVLGRSLELGFGPRYSLELERDSRGDWALSHGLAPFSALLGRWRWRDEAGLSRSELRASFVPYWRSDGDWVFSSETLIRFERVLFAVNDTPFSLFADGEWRYDSGDGEQVFRTQLGLSWALPVSE